MMEMMKKRVFISLPLVTKDLEGLKTRAEKLKTRLNKRGAVAITQFDVCDAIDKNYSYYLGRNIEALIDCDTIYMCEGWSKEKNCQAELHVAVVYGKEIIFERNDWRTL